MPPPPFHFCHIAIIAVIMNLVAVIINEHFFKSSLLSLLQTTQLFQRELIMRISKTVSIKNDRGNNSGNNVS